MRNSLLACLSLLLVFISPSFALAQTSTPKQNQSLRNDLREARTSARVAYKAKLAQIKDTRKQALVDRIDTHIQEINTRRTTQMSEALIHLTAILDRVNTKITASTSQSTLDLITDARTKIVTANRAVDAQKDKDYVVQITTDSLLGQAVKTAFQSFSSDINATHQTVVDARLSVIEAIKAIEPDKASPTTSSGI